MSVMYCSGARVIVFGAFLAATSTARSAPQDPSTTFLYSDICYNAEAGDVLGTRLIVLRLRGGDYVFLQDAQGELSAPQVGTAVIDPKKEEFSFRIAESDKSIAKFQGKMNEKLVTGVLQENGPNGAIQTNLKLPRIVDRQQHFPTCK